MTNHAWIVNAHEEGLSLVEAVRLRIPAAPSGFLNQLVKKQRTMHNGATAQASDRVSAGDTIVLQPSARLDELVLSSRISPRQVLHEDDACIVLDKPAGLMIHPAGGHDSDLLTELETYLRLRRETFRVSPVHRLDIGTSGPVIFGKGRASISALGKMLMAGESRKSYLALVRGNPPQQGSLETSVAAHGKNKESLTRYRSLASTLEHALLELELVTGRRHQIRQQLAHAGWPVAGDSRYRGQPLPGLSRTFLHCFRLSFTLPGDGRSVVISSPLPEELATLLDALAIRPRNPLASRENSCTGIPASRYNET